MTHVVRPPAADKFPSVAFSSRVDEQLMPELPLRCPHQLPDGTFAHIGQIVPDLLPLPYFVETAYSYEVVREDYDTEEFYLDWMCGVNEAARVLSEFMDEGVPALRTKTEAVPKLDHALAMIQHGLPVFPLLPTTKVPATSDGFKSATLDEDKVRAWWAAEPRYNIGMPTGEASGIDVIDLDGPTAVSWFNHHMGIEDDLLEIEALSVSARANGGIHLWIKHDPEHPLPNRSRFMHPDIDTRGTGGYIVAPGSFVIQKADKKHPESYQGTYTLLTGLPDMRKDSTR